MRVIFAGTPEFARVALERIHQAGHEIVLVLTQPDRPAGRGMKLQASAVKQYAQDIGAPVAQPRSLRLDGKFPQDAQAARDAILAAQAQVMVVAAYGLILPQWVLDAMGSQPHAVGSLERGVPPLGRPEVERAPSGGSELHAVGSVGAMYGALNIHGSLLPRWRGAAPIHRAIESGDTETGVTIMQMDVGLDTGDMLARQATPIAADDTTASLHDKVAELGASMIVQALADAQAAALHPVPQPAEGVTYAHKIEKHEAALDWTLPACVLERRVRAFNPFPGASFALQGDVIKVWRAFLVAAVVPAHVAAGTVLAVTPQGVDVATGDGVLRLTELQRAGARRMAVADFMRGFTLQEGAVLDSVAPPAAAIPLQGTA